MLKKYLCVGTLILAILFESTAVCIAKSTNTENIQYPDIFNSAQLISTKSLDNVLNIQKKQEEDKAKQEEIKKQQQLAQQEELKKQQELAKQAKLKKQQEKLNKINKLKTDINQNTYLNYIKQLGYYKKVYSKDEKLNIRNAILLFQSNHNMSVTGVYDQATKDMLIKRLTCDQFTYLDKVDKAPTNGKWIVVNKTTRVLTLYEGTTVIKKYPVAVGNPATLTKTGKYIINMKIIDPDWGGGGFAKPVKGGTPQNPLGSRWLGINRTDGSYGVHGTNSFYSIGKYVSHGCIRMQNYCVEELFPLVPLKAPVWVGTQSELQKWGITQKAFEEPSATVQQNTQQKNTQQKNAQQKSGQQQSGQKAKNGTQQSVPSNNQKNTQK